MDAKRIAEIRARTDAHVGPLPTWIKAADLIALCDLAERGLAMEEALSEFQAGEVAPYIRERANEILSNPKHERRG